MTKSRPVRPPPKKFEAPKDIRFMVYTNAEIVAILTNYVAKIDNLIFDPLTTDQINEIIILLDRMKFLIGQVKQGKT